MKGRPSGSGSTAVNTASTVTLEAGIWKVYLPSPLSVSLTESPFLSVTVSSSSSYPSSGFTVTVTVLPLEARVGLTFTLPLSMPSTLTVYRVEPEEELLPL